MDAHELRELQRPLKQTYRDDPATALIATRAVGVVDMPSLTCRIADGASSVTAGLHPAAGGSGADSCSADLLLQALVGCAGVTFAAVATAMSVPIRRASIVADGVWDARGTLAVDRDTPVGVTGVTLRFDIDSDSDDATLSRLVQLAERYCVVAQTLAHSSPVTVTYGRS